MGPLGRIASRLLDALAPPRCVACDAPSVSAFCEQCGEPTRAPRSTLLETVPLVVAGSYEPPLSTAIVRFKYEGRAELSRRLARLLEPGFGGLRLSSATAIVPVPLHPRRLVLRGYNQAALLARELTRGRDLHYAPRLLIRTRETESQVGKLQSARRANTAGAFELREPGPKNAVLVDDVLTTGSTVRACAQALARGGVQLVGVVVLAQAVPG